MQPIDNLDPLIKRLRRLIKKPTVWHRELGVSQQRVHNYLHGRPPNADFLQRLCERKHVNINWLLTGEGNPYLSASLSGPPRVDEKPADYETAADLSAISFALSRNTSLRRAVTVLLQQGEEGEDALSTVGGLSREQLARLAGFIRSLH